MTDISIIICCYNSAQRIKPTLDHLAKQKLNGLRTEVVIVDNNLSDATIEIAQQYWDSISPSYSLIITNEKESGLSHARKKGAIVATGKYIIFCDDDNWLASDFVSNAYDIMTNHPNVAVAGGWSTPVFEANITPPVWFTTYQGFYAVGVQDVQSGIANNRGHLWGAGMVMRREWLLAIYQSGYSLLLSDRKGEALSSGGDSELCKIFILLGKDLYYSEDLMFQHYIESKRLTLDYYYSLLKGFDKSSQYFAKYNLLIKYLGLSPKQKRKFLFMYVKALLKTRSLNNQGLACVFNLNWPIFDKDIHQMKSIILNIKL